MSICYNYRMRMSRLGIIEYALPNNKERNHRINASLDEPSASPEKPNARNRHSCCVQQLCLLLPLTSLLRPTAMPVGRISRSNEGNRLVRGSTYHFVIRILSLILTILGLIFFIRSKTETKQVNFLFVGF